MSDHKEKLWPGWTEGCEEESYTGGCHKDCGKIKFEFKHPRITDAVECNCSMCSIRGFIVVYTPQDKLTFTTGSLDDLSKYQTSKKVVTQLFCTNCGAPCLAMGLGMFGVNVRCVDGVDISKLKLNLYDGAKL